MPRKKAFVEGKLVECKNVDGSGQRLLGDVCSMGLPSGVGSSMTAQQRPRHIDDLPSACLELILSHVGDSPLPFSKLPDGDTGASHPLLTSTVSHNWRSAADAAVLSLSFKSTTVGEIHLQNLARFPSLVKLTFQNCILVPPNTREEFALALARSTPRLETLELEQLENDSNGNYFNNFYFRLSEIAEDTLTASLARSLPVWQHLRNLHLGRLLQEAEHSCVSMVIETLSKHPALTRLSFAYSPFFLNPPLSLDDLCATPAMRQLLSRLRELHLWCSLPPPPSMTATSALKSLYLFRDPAMDYEWDSLDWRLLQTPGCMAGLVCLSIERWEIGSLPGTLGGLSGLRHLSLYECELTHLPTTLGNLRALESLKLVFCGKLRELPESLGKLKSLKRLEISFCNSLRALPASLEQLQSLKVLRITSFAIAKLPECIGGLGQLQMLDISFGMWKELPRTLGSLRLLTELKVSSCLSLIALPEEVADLSHLQVLILRGCKALERLPVGIGRLRSLRQLDIAGCKSLLALPPSLMQFKGLEKLEVLILRGCKALKRLPVRFGRLQSLRQLDIGGCESSLALPPSLMQCTGLEKLRELGIEASSAGPWLLESLSQLSTLEVLSINFSGVTPSEIPVGWSLMKGLPKLRKVELVTFLGQVSVIVVKSALAEVIWKPSSSYSRDACSAMLEGLRSTGATVTVVEPL